MRFFYIICGFLFVSVLQIHVSAQAHDSTEIAKLRKFLLQESAEEGMKNYQQLGLTRIDTVDWLNVAGLSWNKQSYLLERISWSNKKLSGHLDLGGFQALKYLLCSFNDIQSVNVTNVPSLAQFDLYENKLDAIDLTTNPQVYYVRVGYNNIRKIDLTNNSNLAFLCCTGNQVEVLDLSDKTKIHTLYCVNNNLTSLKLDNCTALKELLCGSNNLTTLEMNNLPSLETFSCVTNSLTELTFSNCIALKEALCGYNKLTSLDFSSCEKLTTLRCNDNELVSLKIEPCDQLTTLSCENNLLDSLIISENAPLSALSCGSNRLTFLTLPPITKMLTTYTYAPQKYVALESRYDSIDLSDLYWIDETKTRYTWFYKNTTISPVEENEGVFAFDESYVGETFICRAQNAAFPQLVMHYDVTFTQSDGVGNVNPEMKTNVVFASEGFVHVETASLADVKIYTMQGALALTKRVAEGRSDLPIGRGMYVVVVGNDEGKRVIVR